jgi:hypothetical protein
MKKLIVIFLGVALASAGCAWDSGDETGNVGLRAEGRLPARAGSVVVDGCVLETWQRAALAKPAMKKIVREVIMLCLVPREDGTVGPRDPSARVHLEGLANDLHLDGYRVHFGVAFTDESGQRYDGAQMAQFLATPAWRTRFEETLPQVIAPADGVEIDLQKLPNEARASVTALVAGVASVVRPAKRLGVFVPPSVTEPSDLPGGDAFARRDLAPNVDRMRIMTLDYSELEPGPTIDPGWAVDAVRLARSDFANVDVSYPLYGTDFGPRGRRSVTYVEALGLMTFFSSRVERGPTGAPFVAWRDGPDLHVTWFDDAESTVRALGAWSYDVLPPDVGILFYGLGAEQPTLWDELASRTP